MQYQLDQVLEQTFTSASDFFKFIPDGLITRNHTLGFRGHENSEWKLEPTISRFLKKILERYPDRKDRANETRQIALKNLHAAFRRNLIVNGDLPQEVAEQIDLWQYGQHFGLPSPLLDWTYSPYIALFFALRDDSEPTASHRCVWSINIEMVRQLNYLIVEQARPSLGKNIKSESMLNEQLPVLEIVQEINASNKRIVFQQGFFTKHDYYVSLEVFLKRVVSEIAHKKWNLQLLQKFTFPCSENERLGLLDNLDKMNINNRTLFPDITGSVKDSVDSTMRSFMSPSRISFQGSQ